MSQNKIKILYIGGFGRSGSTLIDVMLGKIPAFFSAGELFWIWKRGIKENQLVGDGNPFHESPFWQDVGQVAFGGFDQIDVDHVLKLIDDVNHISLIPKMNEPGKRDAVFSASYTEFTEILTRLYRAIQQVSGCEIIVDSSKNPPYGFLVNSIPDFDVSMLHLVRDSRAVAHSWQRQRVRPEIHWQKQFMPTFSPQKSARTWLINNMVVQRFKKINPQYLFMRYEDFVRQPADHFKTILEFAGKGNTPFDFLKGNSFEPSPMHNVSGNPMRFEKKDIVIKPDAEWHHQMPKTQQAIVTTLTLPLLIRYGYLPGR